ncbi:DUF6263 family protein [Mucilaginibacter sp.]|uniref:DUF6263 family protein n=1 Tax=Mucilaginibacter sp. TaxID=1882438 RepID=UPI003D0CF03D
MKISLTFITLIALSIACKAQKINIALNLTKGSTYYLTSAANLALYQNISGQDVNLITTITCTVSHKVIEVKDSAYVMEVKYDRMKMQMTVADRNIDFDSDKKDAKDVSSIIMSGMLDQPFNIVLTKTGKILSVDHIENLYIHMFDGLPNLTEEKKNQLKAQMQKSFGARSFKTNFEEAFAIFPDHNIEKNDTWLKTITMSAAISAKMSTTFTLTDITDNALIIHGNSIFGSDDSGNGEYKEANGFQIRLKNVSGTGASNIKIDKATGWVIESKSSRTIKADAVIKDSPKIPGGMTYPMTITSELTVNGK